jgi:hypothetical protein
VLAANRKQGSRAAHVDPRRILGGLFRLPAGIRSRASGRSANGGGVEAHIIQRQANPGHEQRQPGFGNPRCTSGLRRRGASLGRHADVGDRVLAVHVVDEPRHLAAVEVE